MQAHFEFKRERAECHFREIWCVFFLRIEQRVLPRMVRDWNRRLCLVRWIEKAKYREIKV